MPTAPSTSRGMSDTGGTGIAIDGRPVEICPTTLTPWSSRSISGTAIRPSTRAIRGPGILREIARSTRIRTRAVSPTARVYGLVSGMVSTSARSCSGTEPPLEGTPSSFGSWPTMIVIASPKMNPVTTDLVRKSAMNPSLAIPPAASSSPTVSASAEVRRITCASSPPARSTTTAADMIAIVELTVTLRWRLVPNTPYTASAANAVVRPSSAGTPARLA